MILLRETCEQPGARAPEAKRVRPFCTGGASGAIIAHQFAMFVEDD